MVEKHSPEAKGRESSAAVSTVSRMAFFLEDMMVCTKRLLEVIAGWLPRHFIGAVLISLPALAVFSHFTSEFGSNLYVRWPQHQLLVGKQSFRVRKPGGWGCLLPYFRSLDALGLNAKSHAETSCPGVETGSRKGQWPPLSIPAN